MDVGDSKNLSIEQLRLLGEAIDSSPSPLTLYDQNYNIIYANKTSRTLWPELHTELAKGVGLEKAAYQAAAVLFPGAPENVIQAAADYAVFTFNSTKAHEMKAGDGRWLKLSHHKIGDRAVAGIGFDITDLKNNEKALKDAKAAPNNLIEVLKYGILVIDDEGLISLFNPAYQDYCRSFGFEVTYGMHVKELARNFVDAQVIDIGSRNFNDWFQEFYEMRFGTDKSFEEEFSLPDGRHIIWHQSYRQLVGNIITITHITDIKNAQLKAESAERSKSEFLANMSHEIRTPMNGVMGMAHLLSRNDLGEEDNGYVKIIQRSSKALLTIINDILDFSKIEAGRISLEQKPFNLRDSLEDVMALLSMAATEKDVELILQIQPNLPENYIGDVGRLRQVITNIFGNAVKFTSQGHVLIQVSGELVEDVMNLAISIQDTGIGIPPDKLDDIFDKFAQADSSTTRQHEGTGLGLTIAKQLVELMGGDITAQSKLGSGAEFIVKLSLPLADVQENKLVEKNHLEGAKALIIDDNAISCETLKQQFMHWNCKSVSVDSVKKALLILDVAEKKNITFDFAILDQNIPIEKGESCVETICAHNNLQDTPIVMLTPVMKDGLTKRFKNMGVNAFLTKPFTASTLRTTLKNIMAEPKPVKVQIEETVAIQLPPKEEENIDILVAEDNDVNRLYIDYVLEDLGLNYKIVNNGAKAVESFTRLKPKLVLMDISMPIMNGYEATQRIRQIEKKTKHAPTPIVALTAHALAGDKEKCLNAGMDNYLSKPLSLTALKRILETLNIAKETSEIASKDQPKINLSV